MLGFTAHWLVAFPAGWLRVVARPNDVRFAKSEHVAGWRIPGEDGPTRHRVAGITGRESAPGDTEQRAVERPAEVQAQQRDSQPRQVAAMPRDEVPALP